MCRCRRPPLQRVGQPDQGMAGTESEGQYGVAVVVPVNYQPGPLQPAVESQAGQSGHSWGGLDQQVVKVGEEGQGS